LFLFKNNKWEEKAVLENPKNFKKKKKKRRRRKDAKKKLI
jgi:hypothetical protein